MSVAARLLLRHLRRRRRPSPTHPDGSLRRCQLEARPTRAGPQVQVVQRRLLLPVQPLRLPLRRPPPPGAGDLPSVHDILYAQKQYRDIHKEGFPARLISLYVTAGMFGHARDLFGKLPRLGCPRSIMSFNTLLSAAVESGNPDKVSDFFFGCLPGELSIKLGLVSYRLLIRAYCEIGRLGEALSALEKMKDDDIALTIAIFDTILTAWYENRRFEDADKVWERVEECGVEQNVGGFSAKMRRFVLSGKPEEAAEVFD